MPASSFEVERQPLRVGSALSGRVRRLAGGGAGMRLAPLPNFAG